MAVAVDALVVGVTRTSQGQPGTLGHENAIIVFPIRHPWQYAVVVRRWSNPSITAAARYVFFMFHYLLRRTFGVFNEMHLIYM